MPPEVLVLVLVLILSVAAGAALVSEMILPI
jgi:hypothetical protein